MSIIITGLEMPTERESFNLTIKYNGTVLDTETGIQIAEAYELPPHGRLIDADALKQKIFSEPIVEDADDPRFNLYAKVQVAGAVNKIIEAVDGAPTIIPASEEGET